MDDAADNRLNGFLDYGISAVCDSLWSDAAVAAAARLNPRMNSSVLGRGFLRRLDISRDMQRLDVDKLCDAALFEPAEERARRLIIRHARVLVADRRSEKFEEAARFKLFSVGLIFQKVLLRPAGN